MPRILVVEDDPGITEAIKKTFSLEPGISFRSVSSPEGGLREAVAYKPDLILLDIKLPGGDGRQILKNLKENAATKRIPVIFLTGLSSEGDRVLGLNLGADDYVCKPFGAMELLARIQAVLRRTRLQAQEEKVIRVRGFVLDSINRIASLNGKRLHLQPREFEVLCLLATRPGKTLTRSYLIENTSSYGSDVSTRSLDTHIKNLRKKLGPNARWIETIPKSGYRFSPPS
ncbi:MAG: response regulator transcription factor [Elusimicrobiota bacterium]|jgi:two-component system phosphate regulon response regulator PhoB